MKRWFLASTAVLAVVLTLVSLASMPAAAQASKAAAKAWNPPRTAYGQPDLQGIWNYSTLTPLERPLELAGKAVLSEEEAAEFE
ncbi:MAG: hypothetical protein DMG12_02710, partial [Acidobacteria bacterium]